MDFLTMSISSSGSWTSVERIMSGTRHPIRFVIEAKKPLRNGTKEAYIDFLFTDAAYDDKKIFILD